MSRAFLKRNDTSGPLGVLGVENDNDVVVVSALRTAIGKARRGGFAETTPDELLKAVFEATMEKSKVPATEIGNIVVGNVQMGGSYAGQARMAQLRAGFPVTVPLNSVNRQCSSGLQAIADVAGAIASGSIDAGIGAGVESMSFGGGVKPKPGEKRAPIPANMKANFEHPLARQALSSMGQTSENVAERYGITRAMQDSMAYDSNMRALRAQKEGRFKREIVPVKTTKTDKVTGKKVEVIVDQDEGPRASTTMEGLAKLRPAFKKDGTSTAGNSSQV